MKISNPISNPKEKKRYLLAVLTSLQIESLESLVRKRSGNVKKVWEFLGTPPMPPDYDDDARLLEIESHETNPESILEERADSTVEKIGSGSRPPLLLPGSIEFEEFVNQEARKVALHLMGKTEEYV